ncbi:hypothetical protein VTK26DRAFT_236 [Humicola hyalothermophila]
MKRELAEETENNELELSGVWKATGTHAKLSQAEQKRPAQASENLTRRNADGESGVAFFCLPFLSLPRRSTGLAVSWQEKIKGCRRGLEAQTTVHHVGMPRRFEPGSLSRVLWILELTKKNESLSYPPKHSSVTSENDWKTLATIVYSTCARYWPAPGQRELRTVTGKGFKLWRPSNRNSSCLVILEGSLMIGYQLSLDRA